jgi:hypothetical protein
VSVHDHIKSKRFGDEVLIHANPTRIHSQALEILNRSSTEGLSKAFWEIFAKRVNESIHLLRGDTVIAVLKAFNAGSYRSDLISGICHFIVDDLVATEVNGTKYSTTSDLMYLTNALSDNLGVLPDKAWDALIFRFAELSHTLSQPDELRAVVNCLQNARGSRTEVRSRDRVLIKRIIRRLGHKVVPEDLIYERLYEISGVVDN